MRQPWFGDCIDTWRDGFSSLPKFIFSDGTLDTSSGERLAERIDGVFHPGLENDSELGKVLDRYPSIRAMRTKCVFYKRIVDFALAFRDYSHVLCVDTDVACLAPIHLPAELPDFAFCIDDVPGYSAHPNVALATRILTGLNAGFLLFRPSLLNFDMIEDLTRRYVALGRIPWWAEQTCWALIAGHMCSSVKAFSPHSVAIISGLQKRSIASIHANRTAYFSRSRKIEDIDTILSIAGQAPVIHFAGPGKPWIQPVTSRRRFSLDQESNSQELHFVALPQTGAVERAKLFVRLGLQYVTR